ncbi:MAG: hypothetical protein DME19_03555 [Verrucomicrobia bacterium]|nr:MAG: hypothetical protein DME19_03555 [Verrucomicrobiota bacterium]
MYGNLAAVGSIFDSSSVVNGSPVQLGGSAYLFQRSGSTWKQNAEVSASDLESFDKFGFSVAVSGSTVLVGAPLKDPFDDGAAYVFASAANTAPVANSQSVRIDEDTAASITLSARDAEGDALTYSVLSPPAKGTLSGAAPDLIYTPNPNENGADSFTFKANDGALDSAVATVSITITPVNDRPSANSRTVMTAEDTALSIALTGNDGDAEVAQVLTFAILGGPGHGTLTDFNPNTGAVIYRPDPNYNGPDSFTFNVTDDGTAGGPALTSGSATMSLVVTPVNDPPAANPQSIATIKDKAIAIQLTGADGDPETAQALTFAIVNGPSHGALSGFEPAAGQVLYTPTPGYEGSDSFAFTVTDDATAGGPALTSAPATVTLTVNPANSVPVLELPIVTPPVINENDTAMVSGSLADADPLDSHVITIAWGDGTPNTVLNLAPGVFIYSAAHQYLDDRPTATASDLNTVTVTADDGHGGRASATGTVTVNNLAPVIASVAGPTVPLALGSAASLSVNFSDVGTLDTHTVRLSWDDGTEDTVLSSGGFTRVASHAYEAAGVYAVGITVADDDTGVAATTFEFIVIYDPNDGFVTGGGWINSPAGAYAASPSLTGKGSFGFVAKYQKGTTVPVGETEFQLHGAQFNFHSTVYEWLVISGPLAQCKGSGTLNGAGDYGFLLTATDGQILGGLGVDRFRIKIWDKVTGTVVYDNVMRALDDVGVSDPQQISGGSIVIHKGN